MANTVYDRIGVGYNITRTADSYIATRILELLNPQKGKHYLDIGCGTGNYTKKVASKNYHFWAIDPSLVMLDQSKYIDNSISWLNGYAESFTLSPELKIDGCIAINTMHHWNDMEKGLQNISSKMELGARIVIFTQFIEQIDSYWLKHYFPIMIEKSKVNRPTEESLSMLLEKAEFEIQLCERYSTNDTLEDIFINAGKNNPSIYFDENVRKGMSNFALFCGEEELKSGLEKLSEDINSGKVWEVIEQYESAFGDYSFVLGIKK